MTYTSKKVWVLIITDWIISKFFTVSIWSSTCKQVWSLYTSTHCHAYTTSPIGIVLVPMILQYRPQCSFYTSYNFSFRLIPISPFCLSYPSSGLLPFPCSQLDLWFLVYLTRGYPVTSLPRDGDGGGGGGGGGGGDGGAWWWWWWWCMHSKAVRRARLTCSRMGSSSSSWKNAARALYL